MKIITRSEWTASYPKTNSGTEGQAGLPNFRKSEVLGISVCQPDVTSLFLERDPYPIFDTIRKEDLNIRGYGDIQYNFGVTSNVEGVFSLRGMCNKSVAHSRPELNSQYISILALVGNDEKPTDVLVQNIQDAQQLVLGRFPDAFGTFAGRTTGYLKQVIDSIWSQNKDSSPPVGLPSSKCQLSTTFSEETSVHVFELIETLAYWNYYRGRNDGVYGPITRQAVRELQADLKDSRLYLKNIDGRYGRYTREAFCLFLKQLQTNSTKLVNA